MDFTRRIFMGNVITKAPPSVSSNQKMAIGLEGIPTLPGPAKEAKSKIRVSRLSLVLGRMAP